MGDEENIPQPWPLAIMSQKECDLEIRFGIAVRVMFYRPLCYGWPCWKGCTSLIGCRDRVIDRRGHGVGGVEEKVDVGVVVAAG